MAKGSCESLVRERIVGSVPGLLDSISYSSTGDPGLTVDEDKAVPHVVSECIRHLEAFGLHTLGIFRVSSSKKRVRQLREDFDSGKETILNNDQCPHDVATLLKEFLRDLPDPLLCRDLYHAFVQTQRIRNRRLQLEAMQHLIQILPSVNRDTLSALITFLSNVAKHSNDLTDNGGEIIIGNKMNSTNLATVFAPNLLHTVKVGAKETTERSEDRIDVINVIRTMIDNCQTLFTVSPELLDEVYVHMMDSHPESLEEMMNKREGSLYVDESQDEVSDGSLWSPGQGDISLEEALLKLQEDADEKNAQPRRTYSREEFLHESAATGGPNVTMHYRPKERVRERPQRRRKDESTQRIRREEDSGSNSSITAVRVQEKEGVTYSKTRSSSLESSCSLPAESTDQTRIVRLDDQSTDRRKSTPYTLDKRGIITASLTIPVQTSSLNVDDNDIPYIEDGTWFGFDGKQQMTIGVIRSPVAPPRRRQRSISSDSSIASTAQPITGSISLIQQGYDSALGSSVTYSSPPHNNTPSSISSNEASGMCSSPPSWASTPPTSPDSQSTTVNYIPDDISIPSTTRMTYSKASSQKSKDVPTLHKVSYTSTSEIQRAGKPADIRRDLPFRKKPMEIQKCSSSPSFAGESHSVARDRFNPSITSIGNAVLRSRTADFERITKAPTDTKTTISTTMMSDKKKYTKRRYTDSRHQTRHIPDSESLDNQEQKNASSVTQTVYKRREIISSAPSEKQ